MQQQGAAAAGTGPPGSGSLYGQAGAAGGARGQPPQASVAKGAGKGGAKGPRGVAGAVGSAAVSAAGGKPPGLASALQRKTSMDTSRSGSAGVAGPMMSGGSAHGAAVAVQPAQPAQPDLREYAELMQLVDHATVVDWTTAGLVLGSEAKLELGSEQAQLLYKPPAALEPPVPPTADLSETGFPIPGWSRRNLVSSRIAWARVRLPEQRRIRHLASAANPSVGDGQLTLAAPSSQPPAAANAQLLELANRTAWHSDEAAERDPVLAALSEATEMYVKSVLEKAVFCGRQRLQLDGIRIWYEEPTDPSNEPPPLGLVLGCDVTRQAARAAGNAALACKRMEEALERQEGVPLSHRTLDNETLSEASSMSEIALLPKLANGVDAADLEAKRQFEVYGGKLAQSEPPLGRVPKRAKLEVVDFQLGMQLASGHSRRHKASTLSGSFAF
jgi:hypothetical protein